MGAAVPLIGAALGAGMTIAQDLDDVNSGKKKAGEATAEVAVSAAVGFSSHPKTA
jgi:hypothetical protein